MKILMIFLIFVSCQIDFKNIEEIYKDEITVSVNGVSSDFTLNYYKEDSMIEEVNVLLPHEVIISKFIGFYFEVDNQDVAGVLEICIDGICTQISGKKNIYFYGF